MSGNILPSEDIVYCKPYAFPLSFQLIFEGKQLPQYSTVQGIVKFIVCGLEIHKNVIGVKTATFLIFDAH